LARILGRIGYGAIFAIGLARIAPWFYYDGNGIVLTLFAVVAILALGARGLRPLYELGTMPSNALMMEVGLRAIVTIGFVFLFMRINVFPLPPGIGRLLWAI